MPLAKGLLVRGPFAKASGTRAAQATNIRAPAEVTPAIAPENASALSEQKATIAAAWNALAGMPAVPKVSPSGTFPRKPPGRRASAAKSAHGRTPFNTIASPAATGRCARSKAKQRCMRHSRLSLRGCLTNGASSPTPPRWSSAASAALLAQAEPPHISAAIPGSPAWRRRFFLRLPCASSRRSRLEIHEAA